MRLVLEPAVECSMQLECIYPAGAVAIINSNFDMAPLGLLVHAAGLPVHAERRFNAALFSALHTSEKAVQVRHPPRPARAARAARADRAARAASDSHFRGRARQEAGVVLYTRRRFKGITYLPFAAHVRAAREGGADGADGAEEVRSVSRGETGLLYQTPASVARGAAGNAGGAAIVQLELEGAGEAEACRVEGRGDGGDTGRTASGAEAERTARDGSREGARPAAGGEGREGEVYVSIVLAARNDGHEGNFMTRLQTSLDQLAAAARMHPALSAEVVLVEWAPPAHRPPLRRALSFAAGLPPVRIISVPAAVHDALPQARPAAAAPQPAPLEREARAGGARATRWTWSPWSHC